MAATLTKADTATDGQRWVFQDVHPGGVAAAVGIQSGRRSSRSRRPGARAAGGHAVQAGRVATTLTVRKPDGSTTRSTLAIPGSQEKKRPIVVPDQVVTARKLESGRRLHPRQHVPWRARDGCRTRHQPSRVRTRVRAARHRSAGQYRAAALGAFD